MRIKIALVDDHQLVRSGIKKIIDDFGSTLYSFSNSLSNTTMYLMQGCKWSVGVNFSNLILLVRRARNIAYNSLIYTIRC